MKYTAAELEKILADNIAKDLRHPDYERIEKVGEFAKQIVFGEDQAKILKRFRRSETAELERQRLRLTNTLTKFMVNRPRRFFKKIWRTEGVNVKWETKSDKLAEIKTGVDAFTKGMSLAEYLNEKLEFFGVTDPNAWIFYEREDERDATGLIVKTNVYPMEIPGIDVLNWKEVGGVKQWVVIRIPRMETTINKSGKVETWLQDFYLYAAGWVVSFREAGETDMIRDGEVKQVVVMADGKKRTFFVRSFDNDTIEIPGAVAGAYKDDQTSQRTMVPWFDPAEHVFYDVIRDKSFLDVIKTLHAFPKRTEFVKVCEDRHPDLGNCERGWYGGHHDEDHRCKSCHGSGRSITFTTEQQIKQLPMPTRTDELLDLSKLVFVEPTPIDLPAWFDSQIDKSERRMMDAIFNSGILQQATGSAEKSATLTNYEYEDLYDLLLPFAQNVSSHFELCCRVYAQYIGIRREDFRVDHRFPKDFKMKTLSLLVDIFDKVRQSGVGYYAIQILRRQVLEKLHEDDPITVDKIMARYDWLPFDDKSETELAQILAMRSPLDDMRVLRENWLQIMDEIDDEHKEADAQFYQMTREKQGGLIQAKIEEFKGRITLADAEPPATPETTTEETPAE